MFQVICVMYHETLIHLTHLTKTLCRCTVFARFPHSAESSRHGGPRERLPQPLGPRRPVQFFDEHVLRPRRRRRRLQRDDALNVGLGGPSSA